MSFEYREARREQVSLLIAIAGASGSGKTLSALKIARGLCDGDDTKIAFIDTEAGRALHYAPAPGETPGPNRFAFRHGDLKPPFSPEAYEAAIDAADKAGFTVIVIDSYSHSWEGDGGLHDIHQRAVEEAIEKAREAHNPNWGSFDPTKAAERASVGAWKEPKRRNKHLVSRLLQCRAHIIFCLRADEKLRIEQVKDDRGRTRTVIVQPKDMPPEERWVPICEKRFPYEMTLSLILTPQNPGVPIPIKLQDQHRAAVPLDYRLSEQTGQQLAAWARGGATETAASSSPAADHGGEANSPSLAADPRLIDAYETFVNAVIEEDGKTAEEIGAWWNSDNQKAERRRLAVDDTTKARIGKLTDRVRAAIEKRKVAA